MKLAEFQLNFRPKLFLSLKTCTMVSTVAILAQGTSLALASQQAFCLLSNDECESMAKSAAVATAGWAVPVYVAH